MARPIKASRQDRPPAALREIARTTKDGGVVRRLQAIAAVLEGHSRGEAAHLNGMQRQTLRDWVHRYNEHGVAGLISRQSPGRPSALSEEQMEELRQMVLAGPDLERHCVGRWRCADLRKEIAARWLAVVHENTVGRFLHRLEMTRLQPRPQHPKTDAAAQEDFKKNFARLVAEALPETASGKPIEIWFQDEARVGQQGSLEYIWAPVGSRPRMVRDNRHDFGVPVWRDLPSAPGRRRHYHAGRQHRSDERAPGGDRHPGRTRRACGPGVRSGRLASEGQAIAVARQHLATAAAALFPRTQPHGEHLGLPARQLAQCAGLGQLRGHPGRLQGCLEFPDQRL